MSDGKRANLISLAGIAIILLSAGAALLPAANGLKDSVVIGSLLLAAGIIEAFAGTLRREVKPFALAAGAVTVFAGLLFLLNPTAHFFPTVTLIIVWLVIRSLILAVASRRAGASVRMWTSLSAGMDFLLALLLVAGLSVATIVVSIFGPTPPLIASFAWVLAASFIVDGLLLLEVASCERRPEG
jgi:uncharacterized membrane protein HdeD (DUF308 family)